LNGDLTTDTNNTIIDRRNEMKTNEEVYDEIRDKEEFIAAKLLGKKQHAVYMERKLYDMILNRAKHEDRSFNNMLVRLVLKGLDAE
jgi:hypothetical protein